MAGIGFELHRMIQADRLGTSLRGFLHAGIIAAGPWLLTCLALAAMPALLDAHAQPAQLLRFHNVAVLAFSISLVAAGPIVLVVSRCLADAIYAGDLRRVPSMLPAALARVFGWLVPVGFVVFGLVLDLPAAARVAGFLLLLACGGVWIAAGMLSALRGHGSVVLAFVAGMVVALLAGRAMQARWHEVGLLSGLLLGQVTISSILVARLLAEFPPPARRDETNHFDLAVATDRFRHLAWAGLLYSVGLWIDKWLMWLAPGAERSGRGVWSHPTYEGAMFLAFLTIVPVLAIFLLDVETRFHRAYLRWFRAIDKRATLRGIRRNHGALLRITASSAKRLALVQGTIAVIAILASPAVAGWAGAGETWASVFRFGTLGAAFHVMLIIAMAVLAYFDQRRWLVAVAATFLALNTAGTLVAIALGPDWHGWGYAVASLLSASLGYYFAARAIVKLPYMTFVGTNPAVRERRKSDDASSSPLASARRPASVLAGGAVNRPS
jgi:uncharacterized membrane protein